MNLKVGDEVIDKEHNESFVIEHVCDKGIAWTNFKLKVGYWSTTGAGWLDSINGTPMIRKATKLDKALK